MTESLEMKKIRDERRISWLEDWRKNLTNCRHCDKDYFEADVVFAEEEVCPHCKEPLDGKLYYCQEHGAPTCTECNHRV
jgi:phage FluMu protein Com